jgi:hypothetical protein
MRLAMKGPWRHYQRQCCRGVSHDVAVTFLAGIVPQAVRLVGSLSQSLVQSSLALLWTRPAAPLPHPHVPFVVQCWWEAGLNNDLA